MQFSTSEVVKHILARGTTRHCRWLGFCFQDFQKLPQKSGSKTCLTWSMRNVWKLSLRIRLIVLVNLDRIIFLFSLTTSICLLIVCLPTLFAVVLNFFNRWKHLHCLAPWSPTSPNSHYLQRGRNNYAKMKLRFTHKLVHVHQTSLIGVYQDLQRMQDLLVSKQVLLNVFLVENECCRFFWTSKQCGNSKWYRGCFYTSRVSQVVGNSMTKNFWAAFGGRG